MEFEEGDEFCPRGLVYPVHRDAELSKDADVPGSNNR
jgi:hypothetical protein